MGWNTTFLAQRTRSGLAKAHYFAGLGLPGAKEIGSISFDEACNFSLPGKALAVLDQWTMVIDPTMFMEVANHPSFKGSSLLPVVVESRLVASSDRWPAFAFVAFGNSGTYGFASYKDKNRARLVLRHNRHTVFDEGSPILPSDSWTDVPDEEDLVLGLIPEATGISFPQLESSRFTLFEFNPDHIAFIHAD